MKDKLLSDYIKEKGIATYPDFSIKDILCAGEWVMFNEQDVSGHYTQNHMINLIDILAWVYVKVEA